MTDVSLLHSNLRRALTDREELRTTLQRLLDDPRSCFCINAPGCSHCAALDVLLRIPSVQGTLL